MSKKWIIVPLALLSIISVSASSSSANASHRQYRSRRTRSKLSNNQYVRKNVNFYHHGKEFKVHGRVTPFQMSRYFFSMEARRGRYTSFGILNSTGRLMLVNGTSWHYCTLQNGSSKIKSMNVSTGKAQKETTKQAWLKPSFKRPVHMHTPMHRGYYYLNNGIDTSSLHFVYHHTTIYITSREFGFALPLYSDSHYHGTENQLIANLRKYKMVAPKGFILKNNRHKAYQVVIKRYKYASKFPTPIAYVVTASTSIPAKYNEDGRLVYAGIKVSHVNKKNLFSKIHNRKLKPLKHGFKMYSLKRATLATDKNGNEYVNIPTHGPRIKSYNPSSKLHWIKAHHQCQLYRSLKKNGTMYHPAKTIRPGYNDTFHLTKIIKMRARNGHTYGRYRIKYNGRTYYATTAPNYTENCYYQPEDMRHYRRIKTILPVKEYRSHYYRPSTLICSIHRGKILHIRRIIKIGRDAQYRFILRNGHYVTANKNFVKLI